jgi:hypothetical protein
LEIYDRQLGFISGLSSSDSVVREASQETGQARGAKSRDHDDVASGNVFRNSRDQSVCP